MIIWTDEIIDRLKDAKPNERILVYLGYPCNFYAPILNIVESSNIGWREIQFKTIPNLELYHTIRVDTLISYLPKGELVMLQMGESLGKSYPITRIFHSRNHWVIACDDSDLEYWDELGKWKIE